MLKQISTFPKDLLFFVIDGITKIKDRRYESIEKMRHRCWMLNIEIDCGMKIDVYVLLPHNKSALDEYVVSGKVKRIEKMALLDEDVLIVEVESRPLGTLDVLETAAMLVAS